MHIRLAVLAAVVAAAATAAAQPQCSNSGWLEIKDQAGLQSLQGCTSFTGSIKLGGSVSDLSPLAGLASVSLSLNIEGTKLTSLKGLEALKEVNDKLYIKANPSLNSLAGLEGLNGIGHGLFVEYNNLLSDISSLKNVKVINRDPNMFGSPGEPSFFGIHIRGNPKLPSLSGLQGATTGGEIVLENLPLVTDLSGLPAPGSGELRKLILIKMDGLRTLETLPPYKGSKNMELTVSDCASLSSIKSPLNIPSAPGMVKLTYNAKLNDIEGLNAVVQWPNLVTISGNPALCDFKGLNTTILTAQPTASVTNDCGRTDLIAKNAAARPWNLGAAGAAAVAVVSALSVAHVF